MTGSSSTPGGDRCESSGRTLTVGRIVTGRYQKAEDTPEVKAPALWGGAAPCVPGRGQQVEDAVEDVVQVGVVLLHQQHQGVTAGRAHQSSFPLPPLGRIVPSAQCYTCSRNTPGTHLGGGLCDGPIDGDLFEHRGYQVSHRLEDTQLERSMGSPPISLSNITPGGLKGERPVPRCLPLVGEAVPAHSLADVTRTSARAAYLGLDDGAGEVKADLQTLRHTCGSSLMEQKETPLEEVN
ncbi:hypothetical protein EYF80_047985 [Liparis tanakae]|uniref:Uncharacterized protein n=1 Tax=Liparis tanakae TaxID=230148 RepID=A0A4Z2FLU4_9TELE|nr:hypothetical protein EYF80_047985 [Liparis tanakae]